MDALKKMENDLTDPITGDLFADPVTTPCGHTFGRLSLTQALAAGNPVCPSCRADLSAFDPMAAAKNIQIAGAVETYVQLTATVPHREIIATKPKWAATLTPVIDNEGKQLPVGELQLTLEDADFSTKPSLFIAVVDRSGSMSGSPWKQVEMALLHIMALNRSSPFVKTIIVAYDSIAAVIDIPPSASDMETSMIIKNMFTAGGTNFHAAFAKVKEVLASYKPDDFGNVQIAFLTDGQSGEKPDVLVKEFADILKMWTGPLSVHSIGFGSGCDKDLLEGLRQIGSGTFRYAEPSDDGDTLCNKLTSLFALVSKSSTISMRMTVGKQEKEISFPVDENKKGRFTMWYPADAIEQSLSEITLHIPTNNSNVTIPLLPGSLNVKESRTLYNNWLAVCVDELAAETLDLSKRHNSIPKELFELHCSMFLIRLETISNNMDVENPHRHRLLALEKEIESLRMGLGVNLGKLSDMRFGSQFLTDVSKNKKSIPAITNTVTAPPQLTQEKEAREITRHYTRNNTDQKRNPLQEAIMAHQYNHVPPGVAELLKTATLDTLLATDVHGNNTIMMAAYCGHSAILQELLKILTSIGDMEKQCEILERLNNDKETALTLAIKARGFFKTIRLLVEAGATIPEHRRKILERYAVDHQFRITADLISNSAGGITNNITRDMTPEYIKFVYDRAITNKLVFDANMVQEYLQIALEKKLWGLATNMLQIHGAKPTWQSWSAICIYQDDYEAPVIQQHTNMAITLLDAGLDINTQHPESGDSLLFHSCEKGSSALVQLLLQRGATVDLPNALGNTPLWISCWKRYPCIIGDLLTAGANVNQQNTKGNPPLVSICQKGPKKIAEKLLMYGADVNLLNQNGDSMILICCRCGQHEVLELLLNQADPTTVEHVAHIDGFDAVFASVEANRPECLQIIHDYYKSLGQNIKDKVFAKYTEENNPILPVSTPLHLAAYYGREAAAQKLLELGCPTNLRNGMEQTPMHIAAMQGQAGILRLLKNNKADMGARDRNGNTPVAYCRDDATRRILINPAFDIVMRLARGDFPAESISDACALVRAQDIKMLQTGCPNSMRVANLVNSTGYNPFMESVIYGNVPVALALSHIGALPSTANSHGVNSYTWSKWINNGRIKACVADAHNHDPGFQMDTCALQLDRLQKMSRQSGQEMNILYLGTPPKKFTGSTQGVVSGIGARMDTAAQLPAQLSPEKLAAWQEMLYPAAPLKNTSSVPSMDEISQTLIMSRVTGEPQNQSFVEQIRWQSKVFATSMVASGLTNLTASQIALLYLYPTLAESLNTLTAASSGINYVRMYYSALKSIESYQGEVYLGTTKLSGLDNRQHFQPGKTVSWPYFISASSMWRVATDNAPDFANDKKQGTVFIIKSKSGRPIGGYSQFPSDAEIVFLPHTEFKVTNWYLGNIICLGQSNIREHTFRTKEEDRARLMNGHGSLIIELTEI